MAEPCWRPAHRRIPGRAEAPRRRPCAEVASLSSASAAYQRADSLPSLSALAQLLPPAASPAVSSRTVAPLAEPWTPQSKGCLSSRTTGGDVALTPSTTATATVGRTPRAAAGLTQVNISSLGSGGYRSLYLQAVAKCGDFEVVEDPDDADCDLHFLVPLDRDKLHAKLSRLRAGSHINHFPGMIDVCEKVTFCRVLRQAALLCPRLRGMVPDTWLLPEELPAVLEMLESGGKTGKGGGAYIVKPEYGLQGNGIFIVRTRADLDVALAARGHLASGNRFVCQHYVTNPLTLHGFKFDFRLYVVLTSLSPLRAHLCREGLARFCTTRYEAPTCKNISNRTGHLTNYALNSREIAFARNEAGANSEDASKRLLSTTLGQVSQETGGRFKEDEFWEQAEEMVSLLMVAFLPGLGLNASQYFQLNESEPSRCYHVLGLDVLLDSGLRPWLLEVNSAPAMDIETAIPEAVPPAATRGSQRQADKEPVKSQAPRRPRHRKQRKESSSPAPTGEGAESPKLAVQTGSDEPGAAAEPPSPPALCAQCEGEDSVAGAGVKSPKLSDDGHVEKSVSMPARLKKRQSCAKLAVPEQEALEGPKYSDPWDGYRPSRLRQRKPWPEVCFCTAHSLPHKHSVCEVDQTAKTLAMINALRLALGDEVATDIYTPIRLADDLQRVSSVMLGFVTLCSRLRGTRSGLSWRSLRRVLQASERLAEACGGSMGKRELDIATTACSAQGGGESLRRSRQLGKAEGQEEELSAHAALGMVLEVSKKICQRSAELAGAPPLDQLEWLLCMLEEDAKPDPPAPVLQPLPPGADTGRLPPRGGGAPVEAARRGGAPRPGRASLPL